MEFESTVPALTKVQLKCTYVNKVAELSWKETPSFRSISEKEDRTSPKTTYPKTGADQSKPSISIANIQT